MGARLDRWADVDASRTTRTARRVLAGCGATWQTTTVTTATLAVAPRIDAWAGAATIGTFSALTAAATWPRLARCATRLNLLRVPLDEWWRQLCDDAHMPTVPDVIAANVERTRLLVRSPIGAGALDAFARNHRHLAATLGQPVTVWVCDDHPGEAVVYIGRRPSVLDTITDWTAPADVQSLATQTITIGRSETGTVALPLDGHWLIAGRTGSGKTELVRTVLAAVADDPLAALAVSNLKGDLGDWRQHARWWSRTPGDVTEMMQTLAAEAARRGAHLDATGTREIVPSAAWPLIVAVLDEVPRWLSTVGRSASLLLDEAAATWRALGMRLVLTAQHPTVRQLGDESAIRANLGTIVCLRVRDADASKAALGVERDVADASTLPDAPGWCYVARDGAPMLAHTYRAPVTPEPRRRVVWPAPVGTPVVTRHRDMMSADIALVQGGEAEADIPGMSDVLSVYGTWPIEAAQTPAGPAQTPAGPLVLTGVDRAILDTLAAVPGLTIADLARAGCGSAKQIGRRLDILAAAGRVVKRANRWEVAA